jgi:DNA recombination protein RmuC
MCVLSLVIGFAVGWWWHKGRVIELSSKLDLEQERITAADAQRVELTRSVSELTNALENARSELAESSRIAEGSKGRLEAELAAEKRRCAEVERSLYEKSAECEVLKKTAAKLESASDKILEQQEWIKTQKSELTETFKNLANTILEEKSEKFTASNTERLEAILGPFRERLQEFKQRVDAVHTQDLQDRATLIQRIAELTSLNQQVAQEATNLTRALTVTAKTTGNWGESILKGILDRSGLRLGQEYELQLPVKGQEGEQRYLDALLRLPENRQVIIDSKVSNKAWANYVNAQSESVREDYFREHLASLRSHIRGLAQRDYPDVPGLYTVDFVLMFVPVEAALLEALNRDPMLYEEAYSKRVVMVTPTNLMVVVKLIESLWTVQRRKEFADRIADDAGRLHDKLAAFVETYTKVGRRLNQLVSEYEDARKQLSEGKGNALAIARGIIDYGVRAKKALPENIPAVSSFGSLKDE